MELSITLIIIIVTTLVSLGAFSSQKMMDDLIFYPPAVSQQKQWWRFFTCGFIHADFGHLIFNMLALYLFGQGSKIETPSGIVHTGLEYKFSEIFGPGGRLLYLAMYLLALLASLIPTYTKNKNNYYYRSLGASGAVSAVVFAKILFDPITGIGLFFIPVYIAGFLFAAIYLIVSGLLQKKGGTNINHSAHIFGAIFGLLFTIILFQFFSDFPILTYFIEQIRHMNPKDIIQYGG